jgi:hypothetical protein
MYFLVDSEKNVIFGWSPKCGCSHIKRIFKFLKHNEINSTIIHSHDSINSLPDNIENYTIVIIARNPYKRIVSGFLDKYKKNGEFRSFWKSNNITFSIFLDKLIEKNWEMIEPNHFIPQTEHDFDYKIKNAKCIKCYDISNIDYKFIENLYNIKIPEIVLNKKEGHERQKYNETFHNPVYDLNMDDYYEYNIDINLFYNQEIKNKIYNFYKNDFDFFNELGINYII